MFMKGCQKKLIDSVAPYHCLHCCPANILSYTDIFSTPEWRDASCASSLAATAVPGFPPSCVWGMVRQGWRQLHLLLWSSFALLEHSQVCHGDQSFQVPEKSDLPGPHTHISLFPVILDSLVLPVVTVYFYPWVPQEHVGCLQKKKNSHLASRENWEPQNIFTRRKFGKYASCYFKSIKCGVC